MTRRRAEELFARRGEAERYIVEELARWLDRDPKFWDEVATAHLLNLTQSVERPRPALHTCVAGSHEAKHRVGRED